jgi:MFS family permease
MSGVGVGALIGTASLTMRRSIIGLGRRIVIATALCGVALIAFGFSHVFWLSLLILPVLGFGLMQQMAPSNTILQTIVEDEKRGRVMAFYSMAFQGMAPFGSLLAGNLAGRIGAPRTVMINGCVCLLASAWFARRLPAVREIVRPIYVKMGILPES